MISLITSIKRARHTYIFLKGGFLNRIARKVKRFNRILES